MLLVCHQHRLPAFVHVAKPRWYVLLSNIGTRCSYAVNTADLPSYTLQNFFGTHRCPTFVHAGHLPLLPLATFLRAARLLSTSSTCVRTRCKTLSVRTPVLYSYALLVCCLHRRPAFVRVAEARWYTLLAYIRMRCSYVVNTADLRSYALQNLVGTHRYPSFVHAACLLPLLLATFVLAPRLRSTPLTCLRTCCRTSLVRTSVLYSYMLRVCHHHRCVHSYALLVCCSYR